MEVMEIVNRETGHISPYPWFSHEARSMRDQIDWQRMFHPAYRYFYRRRYYVSADDATATENAISIRLSARPSPVNATPASAGEEET